MVYGCFSLWPEDLCSDDEAEEEEEESGIADEKSDKNGEGEIVGGVGKPVSEDLDGGSPGGERGR